MACQELALGKDPIGIHTVGIGNVFRQAAAKCVSVVAGPLTTIERSSNQLCAGLKAGVDGAVHVISAVWAEMVQDELNGFLVIEAENTFNFFSRVNMLCSLMSVIFGQQVRVFLLIAAALQPCSFATTTQGRRYESLCRRGPFRENPYPCSYMVLGYFHS